MRDRWKKVTCKSCGMYLAEVKKGTEVYCPRCSTWIKV